MKEEMIQPLFETEIGGTLLPSMEDRIIKNGKSSLNF